MEFLREAFKGGNRFSAYRRPRTARWRRSEEVTDEAVET
jgi:hypothetical protein